VVEAARRGAELTRHLLAMGRSQPLALAVLDLRHELRRLVELLRRVLPATVQVDLIEHASDLHVQADTGQLQQVLLNLCINARDAMLDGGRITIECEQVLVNGRYVETHPWATPGRYVLVSVTDTGMGIAPEVLGRIFEPFFTTKRETGGSGLGLAVAYGIVRQHRGMLHAYSEPGVGSTFKVYLPLHLRLASQVGPKIAGRVRGGTERVLLAEDDAQISAVVARVLRSRGYGVEVVGSGEQAVRMFEGAQFDLVLMDVIMPGWTCQETVTALRAHDPAVRILLASGYSADTNVAELLRSGRCTFVPKPYDPDGLLTAVRTALDGDGRG
jgi:CheY-like chemotaxis protein